MKQWQKVALAIFIGFVIMTGIFIINQFVQLYRNIALIHPLVAWLVVIFLAVLIIYILALTIRSFIKVPKQIELADGASQEDYEEYLAIKHQRLQDNLTLKDLGFDWQEIDHLDLAQQIQQANQVLEAVAMDEIKETANSVFLTTAVSQNGSLDSITVLYALMKMVWRLIHLYDSRPSLPGIVTIYTQVFSTVILSRSIEDLDLIEDQIEPLVTSLLGGSLVSMIPGTVSLTNVVVNSIVEGAVNALLTLRVGIITIDYLGTIKDLEKNQVKRHPSIEATKLLGSIIKDNAVKVIKIFAKAVKKTGAAAGSKINPLNWDFSRSQR